MRLIISSGVISDTSRCVADSVTGTMTNGQDHWSHEALPPFSARPDFPPFPGQLVSFLAPNNGMLASAIERRDYTLACALATEPTERMMVEHAILAEQSMAAVVPSPPPPACAPLAACLMWCKCAAAAPLPSTDFKMALRGRDWTLARALARTDEEQRDVAHSIMRVHAMEALGQRGEYDEAIKLAILRSEVEALRERKANPPQERHRSPSGRNALSGRLPRGISGESSVRRVGLRTLSMFSRRGHCSSLLLLECPHCAQSSPFARVARVARAARGRTR